MRYITLVLAACAAATLNWSGAAQSAPQEAGQRLGHITIRSVGTGSPVVLIPGLASPAAVFDEVAARVGKDHRLNDEGTRKILSDLLLRFSRWIERERRMAQLEREKLVV